ncbi:MAG: bacterial transcriptional activator domain-containing protein [Anaerolineae bacterium]|jgi:DNA-binding SARP family transcriptional activator|nr:bacterial transcriptional activator domain-containing protein [Anaerolineae bacterium]
MIPTTVEIVAETSFAEFQDKLRERPLVILYPRHRGRNALVAMFLQHYGQYVIYYSLAKDDATLNAWLDHMVNDEVFPAGFGDQTRAALASRADPEDLAAAFGADLFMLRSESFILLLDTFDRLRMNKAADRFFRALPEAMPAHAQIAISARLLDLQPWNDLLHAGQAAVVGNDEALDGGIYGEEPRLGQLEVFSLAGGHVYIDGRPVTRWDGSLPRHLFYYFVENPMVTRDEIFEVFWPKMSVKEATNVFHVTKRKISERLGYELTNYSGGFYIPSVRLSVHYDARLFEDAVTDAIEYEENAPANWYKAIQIYRTDFLPGIKRPWVETRRAELKHRYAQALIGLGRFHRGLGEMDHALGYLLRALREKPDWEDVHRDVMLIYYQQGRRDDAIYQYQQLTQTLKSMFGVEPSKDTRRLYDTIAAI